MFQPCKVQIDAMTKPMTHDEANQIGSGGEIV